MTNGKRSAQTSPPAEQAKRQSHHLRGELADECQEETDHFSSTAAHVLKHHGVYQQDDRDQRAAGHKDYSCFVRTRMPGGVMTAEQLRAELDLCDRFGNGTLRLTDRQGVQIHGISKSDLPRVIQALDQTQATTLGACGDVLRNVMCCPAPLKQNVRHELLALARSVSRLFLPQSSAYRELWLREGEQTTKLAQSATAEEPFYGQAYLPRKFKIGFALPEDNCIDVLTHDLGFVAVAEQRRLAGFDAYLGGGMGVTPARSDTFAAVARPAGFVPAGDVIPFVQAVMELFRDSGNRSDRRQARLRYLIAERGFEQFMTDVEQKLQSRLPPPRGRTIHGTADHLGWHQTDSESAWLGLYLTAGRIRDTSDQQMKTALAEIAERLPIEFRVTAHQNLLLCGITTTAQQEVTAILTAHGVAIDPAAIQTQRLSMACPALPLCGLAITEAERVLPSVLSSLQVVLERHGIPRQALSLRMTGCPNGCARPYVAEVAIVGKARDRYTLFLGGSPHGTRLAFLYRDLVPLNQIVPTLEPLLARFARERQPEESFGDYCHRIGPDQLRNGADAAGFSDADPRPDRTTETVSSDYPPV